MKLAELARQLNAEMHGDEGAEITGVDSIERAGAGQISYVSDASYLLLASQSSATALVIPPKLADERSIAGRNLLIAKNAKLAFARVISVFFAKPYQESGISPDLICGEDSQIGRQCSIHPRVTIGLNSFIGDRVTLHPGVVVGNHVRIGNETEIFPNVSIYDDTEIGARCRIHSGTVIGADGFSFTPDEEGRQFKLLQTGRVVIEDEVEIGANCCIDRAGFGETRIRRGAKFDNLIQIGHNVEIGEDTVVAALAGFSGGTRVGRRCIIAGQIGTNQHITIGDGAIITARTGVTKSVAPGKIVGGMMPAQDFQQWRKSQAIYARLPEIFERLKKVEKKLVDS
jgi:UDP-3-O-[3-hydroxymyristoyl] glucosamine N-acyltransferase